MKSDEWAEMIDDMVVLARLYRSLGHSDTAPEGQSLFSPRYWALGSLVREGPQPMTALARKLNISKPNLTVIAGKLVEDGLVVRTTDDKDGRVVNLVATEEGIRSYNEAQAAALLKVRERLTRLRAEDAEALIRAVRQLTDILLKMERSL